MYADLLFMKYFLQFIHFYVCKIRKYSMQYDTTSLMEGYFTTVIPIMNLIKICPICYIPLWFCFLGGNTSLREIKLKFLLSLSYSSFNSTNKLLASGTRHKAKKLISTTCEFLEFIRTVLCDSKSDMTVPLS